MLKNSFFSSFEEGTFLYSLPISAKWLSLLQLLYISLNNGPSSYRYWLPYHQHYVLLPVFLPLANLIYLKCFLVYIAMGTQSYALCFSLRLLFVFLIAVLLRMCVLLFLMSDFSPFIAIYVFFYCHTPGPSALNESFHNPYSRA